MDKGTFEWDQGKNETNNSKTWVSFFEAQRAFLDPKRIIAEDVEHSRGETRYYCLAR